MKQDLPEIGKIYRFFDDGITTPSRCYEAKVTDIIPYSQEYYIVNTFNSIYDCEMPMTLQNILKEKHEDNPDLYAEATDFFVECEIPGYDEANTIWFVRTIQGGWFSMNVQNTWQSGSLDVDGSIYNEVKKRFEEKFHNNWYDEQLKVKGELI